MGRKRSQPAWMRDNSYECANDAVPKREQAVAGPAVAGPAVARGLAAAVTEPLQVAGGEGEELTPYELERQALIARNRQRMFELGIPMAAQELSAISASSKAKAAPKASKPKPKEQPAKRSKRISGEKAPGKSLPEDYKENDEDELVEEKPKVQQTSILSVPASMPGVQTSMPRVQASMPGGMAFSGRQKLTEERKRSAGSPAPLKQPTRPGTPPCRPITAASRAYSSRARR
uniref:Uncharacterized protein n=1 Tax=Dunaliella tertiolecta TaxID=3047 RepID=A0A7S3VHE8_DUNTE